MARELARSAPRRRRAGRHLDGMCPLSGFLHRQTAHLIHQSPDKGAISSTEPQTKGHSRPVCKQAARAAGARRVCKFCAPDATDSQVLCVPCDGSASSARFEAVFVCRIRDSVARLVCDPPMCGDSRHPELFEDGCTPCPRSRFTPRPSSAARRRSRPGPHARR